ncbi:glycosyltransferase [Salinarchaeum laminariae]|uniref:glycosyltransferase n=1 Tax=Salinarchaeum laminariae TaxID=869888 RepID=UPI0020BE6DC3|nr:glycosyltransferase [Salinarchaeum laminariae]
MRIAVVSPETIHHRDADDTRRLQRLIRGLTDRGHEVTVCCGRWWEGAGPVADGAEQIATGTNEAAPDVAPAADPDDLPPAGTPAAGEASERAPDETGVAAADQDPDSGDSDSSGRGRDGRDSPDRDSPDRNTADPEAAREEEISSTVTVDDVTYRAVIADANDQRAFSTWAPLAIRKSKPDVIHAVATRPSTVVASRVGATLARAPVLAEWYDPSLASASDWSTRQALSRPGRIVTPSRLTRRQLLELGATDAKLQVIPNAIDMEQIESVDPDDDGDVVYARRLDEDANLESLFLGLAELRDRGWSATIVGDGPAREEYEQQAKDLRIDDRVTFAGACDREERVAIYRGAHAFAQTARRCVFATELLWALACGCVGIVEYHADSSAHELVEGRERGFRTTNPRETAQAIRDAGNLEQRTLDESFASFDEEAVLEQYESCYETLRDEWGFF